MKHLMNSLVLVVLLLVTAANRMGIPLSCVFWSLLTITHISSVSPSVKKTVVLPTEMLTPACLKRNTFRGNRTVM